MAFDPKQQNASSTQAAQEEQEESDRDSTEGVARQLLAELIALREYAAHFLAATVDETGFRFRRLVGRVLLAAALGLTALVFALAFLIYFLRGVDGAMGVLVGSEWLGHLLTGVLGLAGLFAAFKIRSLAQTRFRREKKGREYELRKADQRDRIGSDVDGAERKVA